MNLNRSVLPGFPLTDLIRSYGLVLIGSLVCSNALGASIDGGSSQADNAADIENYTLKAQATYIFQQKGRFDAPSTGDYSLKPNLERSNSSTATVYAGFRGWYGSEFYGNYEVSAATALSDLHGLGGLSNSENQKGTSTKPKEYIARLFLRQTWELGGEQEKVESAFNQMAGMVNKQRIVMTVGKLSILDLFDNNAYSHDGRSQFQNWAFLTYGAYDYAADTKGYSVGGTVEAYFNDWAIRYGRYAQPSESNGPTLDLHITRHYGDQVEIEHDHTLFGQPGTLHALVFHNKAVMGGFGDAIAYAQTNGGTPDVGNVRRLRDKLGFGMALEQNLTEDLGVFARASSNDGHSETFAFTEIDHSVTGGLSLKGSSWRRTDDTVGLAVAVNGISSVHQQYIALGGHGAFIGDLAIDTDTATPASAGQFRYGNEKIIETYYNSQLVKSQFGQLSAALDYQHIENPAYNNSRGPVDIVGVRMHYEY